MALGGGTDARDSGVVYSLGHSNHPLDKFLELLRQHDVQVVADVRSEPYSKYSPQFEKRALEAALPDAGVRYVFLGRELGGRPEGGQFYDDEGHVLYGRRASSDEFLAGIARLTRGRTDHRIALLCSEEDPAGCHRHLLVGRVLAERGVPVQHIRGDGTVQDATALESPQMTLFAEDEESMWRSIRSVSPRGARPTSSAP